MDFILFPIVILHLVYTRSSAHVTVRPVEVGDNCHQLNIHQSEPGSGCSQPISSQRLISAFPRAPDSSEAQDISRLTRDAPLLPIPTIQLDNFPLSWSLIGGWELTMMALIVPTVTPSLLVPWEAGSQDILWWQMCDVRARKWLLVSVEDWSDQRMDVLSEAQAREQIRGHTMASSQPPQQQTGDTAQFKLHWVQNYHFLVCRHVSVAGLWSVSWLLWPGPGSHLAALGRPPQWPGPASEHLDSLRPLSQHRGHVQLPSPRPPGGQCGHCQDLSPCPGGSRANIVPRLFSCAWFAGGSLSS